MSVAGWGVQGGQKGKFRGGLLGITDGRSPGGMVDT